MRRIAIPLVACLPFIAATSAREVSKDPYSNLVQNLKSARPDAQRPVSIIASGDVRDGAPVILFRVTNTSAETFSVPDYALPYGAPCLDLVAVLPNKRYRLSGRCLPLHVGGFESVSLTPGQSKDGVYWLPKTWIDAIAPPNTEIVLLWTHRLWLKDQPKEDWPLYSGAVVVRTPPAPPIEKGSNKG
jgi:hypothetical protein